MFSVAGLTFSLALSTLVYGLPTLESRQAIRTLSNAEISAFRPHAFYASASYCEPAQTLAWNCGANCDENPTFKPIASGGDGAAIQFWYVGFDPTLKEVVVGHQGTDFSKIEATLTDANFFLDDLEPSLFPGISKSVKTHNGFGNQQAKTANEVLAAVRTGISEFGATSVTTVGHSLGGALALIDAVFLRGQLPETVAVKSVTFGMPRVGNEAFAQLVDAKIPGFAHINNNEDLVPILPGRFLGFRHPNGEKHILPSGAWVDCPGHDNTNKQCTTGEVKNIFDSDSDDHSGPYTGTGLVKMGC